MALLLRHRIDDLLVFAAAAKAGTFSAAGREMGITQTAVSHRVAKLEHDLGVALFSRHWRGVKPTPAGEMLLRSVEAGAQAIAAGLTEIGRIAASGRSLTMVTDFGFASFWLLPRLDRLRAAVPGLDVRLITTRSSAEMELTLGDAAIAFNAEAPDGWQAEAITDEEIVPVASPLLASAPRFDLAAAPLLHLDVPEAGRWSGWGDYLAARGIAIAATEQRLTFNNYPLLIQAAIAGQGVALGWRPLLGDLVNRSILVEAGPPLRTGGRGYALFYPRSRAASPAMQAVRDWVHAETRP